jgi:hypothetical protein
MLKYSSILVHPLDTGMSSAAIDDRNAFYLVQDVMSIALLFALLSQAFTLLERFVVYKSYYMSLLPR